MRMNDKDIIYTAMRIRGETQQSLAEKLFGEGSSPSHIGNLLLRKTGMGVNKFAQLVEALGYEIVVRDPETKQEWTLDANLPTQLGRKPKKKEGADE